MRRIGLVLALGLALAHLVGEAQPTASVRTIGFLGPPPSAGGLVQAFQQGLRELGYVEGQNIRIEYRYTDAPLQGDIDRMAQLAAELVRLKPDVLVVSITEAALAARSVTRTIPIVMANAADPVGAGLVSSLAHPGGNITGLTRLAPELVGKNLEILKEAVPETTRVAVLANPKNPLSAMMVADAQNAARTLGVQLKIFEARTPAEVERAFSSLQTDRVGALLLFPDGTFYLNRTHIVGLALRYRLPAIFQNREFADGGGLLSYGPSSAGNYRRAATYVDKILKGTKPADLPVEQPTKFELVINLKTAKALGLTIPHSLLLRADQVIQ
jgi:putative tryptophan/tyrosine transport system substrate-binding protein